MRRAAEAATSACSCAVDFCIPLPVYTDPAKVLRTRVAVRRASPQNVNRCLMLPRRKRRPASDGPVILSAYRLWEPALWVLRSMALAVLSFVARWNLFGISMERSYGLTPPGHL